jgi:hypothetical protein
MTAHLLTIWDVLATTFSLFFFIAYLFILFQVVSDLFRDHELCSGQPILATALDCSWNSRSDSFGVKPPLYQWGLSSL